MFGSAWRFFAVTSSLLLQKDWKPPAAERSGAAGGKQSLLISFLVSIQVSFMAYRIAHLSYRFAHTHIELRTLPYRIAHTQYGDPNRGPCCAGTCGPLFQSEAFRRDAGHVQVLNRDFVGGQRGNALLEDFRGRHLAEHDRADRAGACTLTLRQRSMLAKREAVKMYVPLPGQAVAMSAEILGS